MSASLVVLEQGVGLRQEQLVQHIVLLVRLVEVRFQSRKRVVFKNAPPEVIVSLCERVRVPTRVRLQANVLAEPLPGLRALVRGLAWQSLLVRGVRLPGPPRAVQAGHGVPGRVRKIVPVLRAPGRVPDVGATRPRCGAVRGSMFM